MSKLKIALGDLRHKTIGRHSVFMPVGIGYIASYALSQIGKDNLEIRLYDDAELLLKEIKSWQPKVIGLSNYCWNSELSRLVFRHAKRVDSSVISIAGGPDFPVEKSERERYLADKPEIDFYIYSEGEAAFAGLIKRILKGESARFLKSEPQPGIVSINPQSQKIVMGEPPPRLMDLDVIPSPYLTTLMDKWFDGRYAPSLETARGCPFTCGYCFAGQQTFCGLATFSVRRVKDELTYMAKKMKRYPSILLSICDSNFGMYPRDEEIARHCRDLQDKYGWPNAFDVTTGKANYERILRIAATLKNKIHVTCSVQSLNPKTLAVIKRKNLPLAQYRELQQEIKRRGMLSTAELIVPMPEETKKSFFDGLKTIIDSGVELVVPYTTMLLKGTFLASAECRKSYKIQNKFRLIPRQFGEYEGEKCFETEEVCVGTNTMPFKDYLEIRGFALISSFFSSDQFDMIHRHLKELEIDSFNYYYGLWKLIKTGNSALSAVYHEYVDETQKELFNSKEEIYNYFQKPENYTKLLNGEVGDNLIMKYKVKLLIECCVPAIELSYKYIKNLARNVNKETLRSLEAAQKWMVFMRNPGYMFKNQNSLQFHKKVSFPYDINAWYKQTINPFLFYKKRVVYQIYYNRKELERILNQAAKLYGNDVTFKVGKLLINWSIKNFWCQCKRIYESE